MSREHDINGKCRISVTLPAPAVTPPPKASPSPNRCCRNRRGLAAPLPPRRQPAVPMAAVPMASFEQPGQGACVPPTAVATAVGVRQS